MSSSRPARVLVLGGAGMLGHVLIRRLRRCAALGVAWTTRRGEDGGIPFDVQGPAANLDRLLTEHGRFDFVINCIAVLQSLIDEIDPTSVRRAEEVNGAFPHRLADVAGRHGVRVIHISTDGVFAAEAGVCVESTPAAPPNVYGRTKLQGEVRAAHVVNVRCSLIGPAADNGRGLLEWLRKQPEGATISGFTDHLWTGCTTEQVAELCCQLITENLFDSAAALGSVHHFCPCAPMSKYELLRCLAEQLRPDMEVRPVQSGRPVTRRLDTENHSLHQSIPKYAPPDAALREIAGPSDTSTRLVSKSLSQGEGRAMKKRLAIILGIRPDVIRASLVLNQIRALKEFDVKFIWSGQHYSDNLKDVFFRELEVGPPDIELGAKGTTDAEVVGSVVSKLFPVLEEMRPEAAVFLGDTNTVMGCLAAGQLNIPIVHIEGCMRSYDWRMPEEKYRGTIDHLADVIYTYFPEYKDQGVAEGLNPKSIVVVQNLIVDVLNKYYYDRKKHYDALATEQYFRERKIERGQFYLMTCHRRENVESREPLATILELLIHTDRKVYFTASYRTQGNLKRFGLKLPSNVHMVDPIGYTEMLVLMTNARAVVTDSGTVVEETAVLQVPSLQMRKATERPQVYDCKSSVKFDPARPADYPAETIWHKLDALHGKTWAHELGDGKASGRIVADLTDRLRNDGFRLHKPEDYHLPIARSYREDGLDDICSSKRTEAA